MPLPSNPTDELLMERFSRSLDERYLAPLLSRYHKPALLVASRYLGNSSDAEDIVQEAFIKVVRNHGKFRAGCRFAPWFYTILRNATLDHLRSRRVRSLDLSEPLSEEFADDRMTAAPLPGEHFEDYIVSLPGRDREILVYRYRHGMTFGEIAEITDEPVESLKKRAQRALAKLRGFFSSPEQPDHRRIA